MGTTVTNADLAELSQLGLAAAQKIIPALNSFSTTFKSDLTYNDTTKVGIYSAGTASSAWDDSTNNYSHANGDITFKDATLSMRYKRSFSVKDYLSNKINKSLALQVQVRKMLRDALVDMLAVVTAENFSTVGVTAAAADFEKTDVNTLYQNAEDEAWDDDRALVLSPPYYGQLLDLYGSALATAGDGSLIRRAALGEILGFSTVQAPVPANSENLVGFAMSRAAIGFVMGTILPDKNTKAVEIAEDPSGFRLMVREHYDEDLGREMIACEILCTPGVVGNGELQRIVSA